MKYILFRVYWTFSLSLNDILSSCAILIYTVPSPQAESIFFSKYKQRGKINTHVQTVQEGFSFLSDEACVCTMALLSD